MLGRSRGGRTLRALVEVLAFLWGWEVLQRGVLAVAPMRVGADGAVEPAAHLLHFLVFTPLFTLLILGLQRLRGERLHELGLRRPPWSAPRTLALGVLAGLALFFATLPLHSLLERLGLEWRGPDVFRVDGARDWLVWCLSGVLAGGFLEELAFRGYLLRRLEDLLAPWCAPRTALAGAVLLSSLEFGRRHAYQGSLAVVSVTAIGLALAGLLLAARGNLVPPMLAHATIDVCGFTSLALEA